MNRPIRFDVRHVANARLDEAQVLQIRRLAEQGLKTRDLAQRFGVGVETVRRVLRGDTWAWVLPERPPASEAEIAASQARLLALLEPEAPQVGGQPEGPGYRMNDGGTTPPASTEKLK